MRQAQSAPGNLRAETRTINGVHHTLSVWTDEAAMRRYLVSGAHIKAMQAFRGMATGKTFGFEAEAPPDWDEVHDLWITKGKEV
jgi:quinol monooxygenase YgiN